MELKKNGRSVSIGSGAACLGHPLRAAFWLARTMASRKNGLKRGQVILSGALGPMQAVTTGDFIQVTIGALGDVCCRMA
jgi:2-keto-4-pentenoate hydratase